MGAIPTHSALRAVRELRRLHLADVATYAVISHQRLQEFEAGERSPSRKQVERLAEIYGVSAFRFFGSGIPNLPDTPLDFRRLDPGPATLTAQGLKSLWAVEKISHFTAQLKIELGYKSNRWVAPINAGITIESKAAEIRQIFDEWLAPRADRLEFRGPPEQIFLSSFRLFIESQGVVLSVNDAPATDYLGFYVNPEGGTSSIFVNRSIQSKKAQLFTLAHEYAHALLGKDGVSNPFVTYNPVEKKCNKFAAEFLAPSLWFKQIVEKERRGSQGDVSGLITRVSARSLLSKHATAIRLLETNYISRGQLNAWASLWVKNPRAEKDEEAQQRDPIAGGVPHAKRITELGQLPVYLAGQAIQRKIIDSIDVQRGIGLSSTLQERAFSLATRRFAIASS